MKKWECHECHLGTCYAKVDDRVVIIPNCCPFAQKPEDHDSAIWWETEGLPEEEFDNQEELSERVASLEEEVYEEIVEDISDLKIEVARLSSIMSILGIGGCCGRH